MDGLRRAVSGCATRRAPEAMNCSNIDLFWQRSPVATRMPRGFTAAAIFLWHVRVGWAQSKYVKEVLS